MKLYHVSLDLTKNTRHFTPRIPKGTTYDEDTSVPRVCFSASLEGALSSCAHIIIKLFNYSLTDNIMVFEVNTDDIVGKIVTPEEAYYCYNVLDALYT